MPGLFCCLPQSRVLFRNETAIVVRDAFPVTLGHTLVIPLRHIESFFDTSAKERAAMFELLDAAKQQLQTEFAPAGFNIGINDGAAAGQTIRHLHMHLIPRYAGDRPDPRGGVRWVIPEKADYWTAADQTQAP
ncbi:MAG: HIT family protein [Hydrogenophaga sp.]|jgi:diadenosine tetraphosphate (Ap4A) HIT family hydrolase|nr:HIT family protein [Hydrogenophaga sp.]